MGVLVARKIVEEVCHVMNWEVEDVVIWVCCVVMDGLWEVCIVFGGFGRMVSLVVVNRFGVIVAGVVIMSSIVFLWSDWLCVVMFRYCIVFLWPDWRRVIVFRCCLVMTWLSFVGCSSFVHIRSVVVSSLVLVWQCRVLVRHNLRRLWLGDIHIDVEVSLAVCRPVLIHVIGHELGVVVPSAVSLLREAVLHEADLSVSIFVQCLHRCL